MKAKVIFIILSTIITISSIAHDRTVSFIHGFGDSPQIWDAMNNQLMQGFDYNRFDVSYNTSQAISTSASSVFIPQQSVAVAHSMGGLLAREYLRQNGTGNLDALITVGTPHFGAPAITQVQNGVLNALVNLWLSELSAGPKILFGDIFGLGFAAAILEGIGIAGDVGSQVLQRILSDEFENNPGISDMKIESAFLNTINSAPESTLPSARYAIFGSEDMQSYVRIADSFLRKEQSGNPLESGAGIRNHNRVSAVYLTGAVGSQIAAFYFLLMHNQTDPGDPNHFFFFDQYVLYQAAANNFFLGYLSLQLFQHIDYEVYVVGALRLDQTLDESDALIPAISQAPPFIGSLDSRILRARSANHLELTVHPSSKERIEFAFNRFDVNIPEVIPLTASIVGLTTITEPGVYNWNSSVSGASGSVQYQWYVDWNLSGNFSPLGTNAFQALSLTGSEGQFALRLDITDSNTTESAFLGVYVHDSGGSCDPFIICVD